MLEAPLSFTLCDYVHGVMSQKSVHHHAQSSSNRAVDVLVINLC